LFSLRYGSGGAAGDVLIAASPFLFFGSKSLTLSLVPVISPLQTSINS
jgi:hypothetical protein